MHIIFNAILFLIALFSLIIGTIEFINSKFLNKKVLFCFSIIIILFPFIVFNLDYYNIPSKLGWSDNIHLSEWLNVTFTYVVGILSAIIGAYMTIRSVKLSIEEQGKIRLDDNKKKALPLLKVNAETQYDYRYKYFQFDCLFTEESKKRKRKDIVDTANVTIRLENVGMRELYDLYIGDIESNVFQERSRYHKMYPIIYKDDSVCINLSFYEMGSYDNDSLPERYDTMINFMRFNCYFKDCYNNWYYQTLQISLMYQIVKNTPLEKKALNISVSNSEILSPPIEIKEENLPWNNGESLCHH